MARREDLEEIADLRKEIIRLTTENADLREAAHDRRKSWPRGDDPACWSIHLRWLPLFSLRDYSFLEELVLESESKTNPAQVDFRFETTSE